MKFVFSFALLGALGSNNKEALRLTTMSGEEHNLPADPGHPHRPWTCWEAKVSLAPRLHREPQSIDIVHPTEHRILAFGESVPQSAGVVLTFKGLGASTIAEFLGDDIFPLRAVSTPESSPIGIYIKSNSHIAIMNTIMRRKEGIWIQLQFDTIVTTLLPWTIARTPKRDLTKSFLKNVRLWYFLFPCIMYIFLIAFVIVIDHYRASKDDLSWLQASGVIDDIIRTRFYGPLALFRPFGMFETGFGLYYGAMFGYLLQYLVIRFYFHNGRPRNYRSSIRQTFRLLHRQAKHLAEEGGSSILYGWILLLNRQILYDF